MQIWLLQYLSAAKAAGRQLNAKIAELKEDQHALKAQNRAQTLQQLVDLEREYLSLTEELNKARDLDRKQIITAPVDGIVRELAIHTIGGVVTAAQPLMKIVPENQTLEAEAWLENKDIGFVTAGQPAELKVHTFPFTKYGIIDGEVQISRQVPQRMSNGV
ncbi:HlyD family efflux transporter periplasmic adaptor subunit [Neptuniibacter sp. CAU 1671]|uniref:HlyD family efflux transporter periplasmic adaptor subunit n=1 Tax=Neptuniibacter sp. CAU 1671 TaxID=3032593 RepID=UPI0023DAA535|nr:HlyD family efflux transporter periplasmic adaptor subunit [Neptuniibacter sp. CAU 1671]MDF2180639.1 HlyD family efflux transporter periplasmic adaptor subunit [Neptuniibacter sp. CAU 1671]